MRALICFQSFGGGKTTIEVIDNNLKYLTYPSGQILSFYDLKDVLDQYDCTGKYTYESTNICLT